MADVIFIGGLGKPDAFGGELTKNKLIVQQLVQLGYNVKTIDTYRSHHNPLKIINLPYIVLRHRSTPIVFSTRYSNIRQLARLVRKTNSKRNIIFWPIGGRLGREVEAGKFTAKELGIFNQIIVESPSMAQQLIDNGVPSADYLPNFKDGSLVIRKEDKDCPVEKELKCVFVSRIQSEKGTDLIIDAIIAANESGRKISVDFYGNIKEDYKEQFFNKIDSQENIRYRGTLNFFDGSGQEILSGYHLFLFPTYWEGEGFPGAVIDAFMSGVPVLASDWLFNAEFISDKTGFLCLPKNTDDFTKKLFDIYDHRETLTGLSESCIREGAKYDVKNLLTNTYFKRLLNP